MSAEALRRAAFAGTLAAAGSAVTLAVFAADRSFAWGVYAAAAGVAVAAFGLLDLAGAFDAPAPPAGEHATPARPLGDLAPRVAAAAGALALFAVVVRLAVRGALGVAPAAFAVPAAFLLAVAAAHRIFARGTWRRPGFWIVVGATLLYLPLLGSFTLIDPWETHYAEVAREMIARGDGISPWWAQGRWFWSKPVLDLWLEAISMRTFGVHAEAGAMIAPVFGVTPRPEWAVRMPAFLFAVVGLYLLYRGTAAVSGRRAGIFAAVALATMPQFFLMARQATTDMPLVGSLAAAMGLVLVGASADPGSLAPSCAVRAGRRVLSFSLAHLVLAGAVALVLPQILYLASRNLTLHVGAGLWIQAHADAFRSGSPGNCDVPGDAPCTDHVPLHAFPPALQAVLWAALLAGVLVQARAERRVARASYLGAFLFAGVATMAKGPLGVALPAAAVLATLAVGGRLRRLARMEIPTGALLVIAATLPWYVAAFVRHGQAFTDELVFRNMIGRATSHLHDTNGADDVSFRYYVWQLGYAIFGWAGLLPAALARWPGRRAASREDARAARRRGEAQALAFLWLALAFALFTAMPTKFHHYVFPLLPPAAMLVGLLLDALCAQPSARPRLSLPLPRAAIGAAALGGAALVLLIARDLARPGVAGEARLLNLVTYNYQRPWPDGVAVGGVIFASGVGLAGLLAALAVPRIARAAVVAFTGAAALFAVWGLDVYLVRAAPHWGQRALIEAYHRARAGEVEPLAAWNMNWKGENFYTGNRVAVFPAGGKLPEWIAARRHAGANALFFLVEHGRVAALRRELGDPATVVPLTDARDNNKFVLLRVSYETR